MSKDARMRSCSKLRLAAAEVIFQTGRMFEGDLWGTEHLKQGFVIEAIERDLATMCAALAELKAQHARVAPVEEAA